MTNKNSSIADSIASEMAELMDSAEYKQVFAPIVVTAAKKEDKKKAKHNHKEDKKCTPFCPAMKKKKADDINAAINGLSKISEILDSYGLVKSAMSTIHGLEQLVAEAEEMCAVDDNAAKDKHHKDDDDDKKSSKERYKEMKRELEEEEEDDNDADVSDDVGGDEFISSDDSDDIELHKLLEDLGISGESRSHSELAHEHGDEEEFEDDIDEDEEEDIEEDPFADEDEGLSIEASIKTAAAKKSEFIFPKTHPKVTDKKDHFPINTAGRGRNALARANQFSKAPTWYKGSLESFVRTVASAVKRKYKGIEVSKASEKPGKG